MKNITIIILLAFTMHLTAQEYSFSVTSELGDSTFQLDVITEINDTRSQINRTKGLDTLGLQVRQYTEINALYNLIATAQREIDNHQRAITNLRNSLSGVGEDYNNWSIARQDSTFAGNWRYRDETATNHLCYADLRDDLGPLIKQDSDNQRIFTIIARSRNYLRLNMNTGAGWGNGDNFIEVFSNDGIFYAGEDSSGVRHVLRFLGQ